MTDIKALTLSELCDKLEAIEKPLVVMHIRPDGDTVGSGAALVEIFCELGKRAEYICADPIPERLAFLTEGLKLSEKPELREAVAIDVPSPMQLGELYDKLNFKCAIDHHAVNTPFAPHYTLGGMSSAGEVLYLVASELEKRGKIRFTRKIAEKIYAAISSDTGRFAYSSANADTYKRAAELISKGIDHADINRRLFAMKSREEIMAEGYVGARVKSALGGRVAYATVSKKERDEAGLDFSYFETSIDIVRALRGSVAAFVVKETDRGEFKASLRSNRINVAKIAARYSGGGHINAAGCTVLAGNVDEAAEILISELEGAFK